ncbi:hypothetical protein Acsp03_04220 [Actinomadura sp. NBRC 104412]|uniref:5-oxoprolinase subunit B family protein n=1 Tax=Actinomadura sp. NBRC 104412 TaxID=3032203 RepID=UPI0024A4F9C3|nr:carboxyltransferase domain-containing protein [Actinomadura sp. NBRC 104412]GLZ02955.1 hypothetical protein Acsp03_04220 [Actinomadura sp. NBRC 104412]
MTARPAAAYRPAGDRYVLVEYGDGEELDLRVNFFVLRALDALTADPPPGLVEAAPGFRSILVRFDPARTRRDALIERLRELHARVPGGSSPPTRSRRIVLPIAFDHSATRRAIERYAATIRADAPYTGSGGNIGYIVEHNGLPDREALYEAILGTEWWTAFTGFAPGLPFMFSMRAPTALSVPKYNPARTWTPEGAVGMGGPCVAIFPVDAPGSYQLFGRTLPIYDILGRNRAFRDDPFLIGPGDRVSFTRVEEDELEEIRRLALEDRYSYQVEDERDRRGAGDP